MKKIGVLVVLLMNVYLYAQAPYGNYLSLAPGQYAANADTCAPAGASHFPAFTPSDTITVEFYHKNNAASLATSSLVGFGPGLYHQENSGYVLRHEYSSTLYNTYLSASSFDPLEQYGWSHVVIECVPWLFNTHRCYFAYNGETRGFADVDNDDFQNTFGPNRNIYIGATNSGYFFSFFDQNNFWGFIDELRISSMSRYHLDVSGYYTVPTSEFISDAQTTCLLHFNGSYIDTIAQDASPNNRDFLIVRNNFVQDTIGVFTSNGFVNSDTLCYGDQVFAVGGDMYSWSPAYGLSDAAIADPEVYLNDTTVTYYVTITNTSPFYTFADTITFTSLEPVDLGPDITACTGTDSITLSIPNIFSDYYWLPDYSSSLTLTTDTAGLFGVIVNISAGCFSSDEIQVDFMNDYYVEGTAYKSDSTIMPGTYIYFINADSDNVVIDLDSVATDINGEYSKTISFNPFYILLAPDSSVYPDQLPVYFDTSLYIQNAVHIDILCDTLNADLYAQLGVNPGGPCVVGGTVVYNGRAVNGDPVVHLKIILMNDNGEPMGYTFTNDTGYFVFNSLPVGNVHFYVDYMGVNNLIAPEANITTTQDFSNLQFELFPDQLVLLGLPNAGIENENSPVPLIIYPNPASESINIMMDNITGDRYRITNIYGSTLISSVINNNKTVDVSLLPVGIYYIELNTLNGITTTRFIKQ